MIVQIPVGNAVVLSQQHAVQRSRSRDLFIAGLRAEQFVQQGVDHRVGNAGVVLAAVDRGLAE